MLLSDAAKTIPAIRTGGDAYFTGCSTDSRSIKAGEMFIALHGGRFDGHEFVEQALASGARAAMVEKELLQHSIPMLIVDDARTAMGQLAGYWRSHFDIPLIAITGSNGKTTVKEMLAVILTQQAPVLSTTGNFNNEIGVPLTLFGLDPEHRYAVVEMGANHPGEISCLSQMARPTVALITQCAPSHLEGFNSIEGVAQAKAEIFEGLADNGTAIVNADDRYADVWRSKAANHRQTSFGLTPGADVWAGRIETDQITGTCNFTLVLHAGEIDIRLNLPGVHNILNAVAAAACCTTIDIPAGLIKSGLEKMQPVQGRLQVRQGIGNSRIYDDTYNANPASLTAALKVLQENHGRRWLVLGDMAELGEAAQSLHLQAGELARMYGVERLYALGQLSKFVVQGFGKGAQHFLNVDTLVESLQQDLSENVILLVKGSRSMSMERIVAGLVEED